MRWSFRIGRLFGIDVFVHFTFLILLGWIVLSGYRATGTLQGGIQEAGFVLLVFGIVILHELGHALAARRYGIPTRDITLLPIGGVARLERMPEDPWQELVVALAGPAVNVVLAGLCFAWLGFRVVAQDDFLSALEGSLALRLLVVNVWLVVFNLLPAFPMDGGRVVRALLSLKLGHARATQIAANIGQAMAILFGFAGLFGNPMLLFIAWFVWIAAGQEASQSELKSVLGGVPVAQAMIRDFARLDVRDTLATAVHRILDGYQQDFPVLEDGRVRGVLTRADLVAGLSRAGEHGLVGDAMQQQFVVTHPAEMVEVALARAQQCACHTLPVVVHEQLVGLLTMDNVGELLLIRQTLQQRRGAPR